MEYIMSNERGSVGLVDEIGIDIGLDGLMYRSESESEHCPFSIGIKECVCVYALCVRVCEWCVAIETDETRTNTSITSPTIQMYEHRYTQYCTYNLSLYQKRHHGNLYQVMIRASTTRIPVLTVDPSGDS